MDAKRKREQVTMKDVAKATGFSPATVSIVLNNAPLARYIAPGTRQKIEESAKRMGYRPNAMARFLRSKRSQSIGVMMFDVTDPFCTPILRGVENALYPLGYLPILADAHNQRAFRTLSRNAAGAPRGRLDRGGQLALCGHPCAGRPEQGGGAHGDDWVGNTRESREFRDGGQRSGRPPGHRAPVSTGPPTHRHDSRTEAAD